MENTTKILKKVQQYGHTLPKSQNINISSQGSKLSKKLAEAIFNTSLDCLNYPKYRLIEGGSIVLVEKSKDKFESFGAHHMSEEGILCDDLETFIKWEEFSK